MVVVLERVWTMDDSWSKLRLTSVSFDKPTRYPPMVSVAGVDMNDLSRSLSKRT
jgi:hypothetical protein